jgi:hypothetical protein
MTDGGLQPIQTLPVDNCVLHNIGIGSSVCMMLDAVYEPPAELDECIWNMIVQFWQNNKAQLEPPKLQITPEGWKTFWKGVYLTCWNVESSDIISEVDAILMNIMMQSGYSPARWCTAVYALLLKKAGGTLIEKLRTIVLFQGGVNYMNNFIGHQMMKNSDF